MTFTTGSQENIVALIAMERGMMGQVHRYHAEKREMADYFGNSVLPTANEVAVATALKSIAKQGSFNSPKFVGDYETVVRQLVGAKLNNRPIRKNEPETSVNVIGIPDALHSRMGKTAMAPI